MTFYFIHSNNSELDRTISPPSNATYHVSAKVPHPNFLLLYYLSQHQSATQFPAAARWEFQTLSRKEAYGGRK